MKKTLFIFIVCISFINCSENKKNIISIKKEIVSLKKHDTVVNINSLFYHKETSLWTLNSKKYSGYAVTKFENDSLKQKFGILNGRKQNEDITWFQNGKIRIKANYHKGKLHGKKQIWAQDSLYTLIAEYNYHLNKGHGKQTKWYSTGELFQVTNLQMGKEDGVQQAFRRNGTLYANYEVKNGRIFGMRRGNLCYSLEDEVIIRK